MKLNKTMIIAGLIAGGVLAANVSVRAQDATNTPPPKVHAPGGARAGMNFEYIAKQLGLSADQKEKAAPVFQDMQQQNAELRKDTTLSVADRRAKQKQVREDAAAKLKEIFTPAQFEQWQKMGMRPHPATPPATPTTPPATNATPQQ